MKRLHGFSGAATRSFGLRDLLIDVDGLAPSREGDGVHTPNLERKLPVEFASQVPVDAFNILFSKSIRRHDLQDCLARRFLGELKLPNANECIIMHVQCSPRDFGAVSSDQDLLNPVAPDVTEDDMLPPACVTAVAHIRGPVAGPIADERHDRINETRPDDLTPPARRSHRITVVVQKLEIAVRGPDMIIAAMLTFGSQNELLALSITREVPTAEHFLHHLPLFRVHHFGLGNNPLDIRRTLRHPAG